MDPRFRGDDGCVQFLRRVLLAIMSACTTLSYFNSGDQAGSDAKAGVAIWRSL
jgi:hypothetical protein